MDQLLSVKYAYLIPDYIPTTWNYDKNCGFFRLMKMAKNQVHNIEKGNI